MAVQNDTFLDSYEFPDAMLRLHAQHVVNRENKELRGSDPPNQEDVQAKRTQNADTVCNHHRHKLFWC